MRNRYAATAFAVITAGVLTFSTGASGKGGLTLWPLFGATNQVLAALALTAITLYLKKRGGVKFLISGIPAVFMIVMTVWALIINQIKFIAAQNWLLTIVNAAIVIIAVWVVIEGLSVFLAPGKVAEAEA
jgi:carbon starvation protein